MTDFRLAYYAYPIDQAPAASMAFFYDFIRQVQSTFQREGIHAVKFDPGDAFSVTGGAKAGPEIERINRYSQRTADLTVAFLPMGVPTFGVPVEIARSVAANKPTVVFSDMGKSWTLAGMDDADNLRIFPIDADGLEEATTWLHTWAEESGSENSDDRDPLPVRLLSETSSLPTRGYQDDAGVDLYVSETRLVLPGEFVDVPCGVAVELPEWSWGLLTGRSSTLRDKQLLVHSGIIDCGYRGPLFAGVWNMGEDEVVVEMDERIAQLIVLPNLTKDLRIDPVDQLTNHPRGEKGFGSTGR